MTPKSQTLNADLLPQKEGANSVGAEDEALVKPGIAVNVSRITLRSVQP